MTNSNLTKATLFGIAVLSSVCLITGQWSGYPYPYATYSPSTVYQPTFANLNSYSTPSPYQNYQGQNVRIWPYVMGQIYNPYNTQYTTGTYNGVYDANSLNYYNQLYQPTTLNKK